MIFFNSGCLLRFCRLPFWASQCYKDRVASASLISISGDRVNKIPYRSNPAKTDIDTQFNGKHLILTSLTSWTQVRYQKGPDLHRDVPFPNFDKYRKDEFVDVRKTDWASGDGKPGITYAIGFFGMLCGAYALKSELVHFIMYMAPAADVLALASIEVDISNVAPGACVSYKWRGKPLFIKYRTQADIDSESKTPMSVLRDPETEEQRTGGKPQWLIVIGICTHLGCVPIPNSGDYPGGFYCPCHGSHYDNIGRARKGPAPLNLEVPPYKFVTDTLINVG